MTFPDGTSFEGKWKQGKRHGKGTITDVNGIQHQGVWDMDQKIA